MAGTNGNGKIVITPEVMRAVSVGVAGCGDSVSHSARAIRALPALSSGGVGAALAGFRVVWSTALAAVADDTRICARKISAAADFWVTLDQVATVYAGVGSATRPSR
jgi:hypothetical protein